MPVPALPSPETCDQARRSRDPRFDGLFFTGVHSTGIYCRPVCPARHAKRVRYFPNAAAAEAAGFRPCLRCRPELSPSDGSWQRGDAALARALMLIDQGALSDAPLATLATRVGLGERQLRRLFVERLGAPPIRVLGTRRLLFAKQLLTETTLPVTTVAMAAGFGSLRRFNATFQEAYRMSPRDLRRRPGAAARATGDPLVLRLGYRPPYDFATMLGFLRGRALPGIERVDEHSYARVIAGDAGAPHGWLRISAWPGGEHALRLELHAPDITRLPAIVQRLRRMFDLDADPQAIAQALSADPRLRPLLRARPGLRLPSGWDGFEIAVRAVLGQQVAWLRRARWHRACRNGLASAWPSRSRAAGTPVPDARRTADADLSTIGLTRARADTVRTVARAMLDGRVDFRPERTLDDFVARWVALPGIGPWTAQYVALRALGHPDAFPAEDLVLRKMAAEAGEPVGARAMIARAEAWRPWRGYAVIHLWRQALAADVAPAAPRRARAPTGAAPTTRPEDQP